jgi:hypothetical protein
MITDNPEVGQFPEQLLNFTGGNNFHIHNSHTGFVPDYSGDSIRERGGYIDSAKDFRKSRRQISGNGGVALEKDNGFGFHKFLWILRRAGWHESRDIGCAMKRAFVDS